MAIEKVREYFKKFNIQNKIRELNCSSATVELASIALNCKPERIAKTISFKLENKAILIVTAGNMKIDNQKYKSFFGIKAKMLDFNEVENLIGHSIGGVCPFGINENVEVYLDESLKNYETIFPACGSSNSLIELTPNELEKFSQNFICWVNVCKIKE